MKKEPYNRPVMTIIMLERGMTVVASGEGDCSPVNEPGNNCSDDCVTDGQSSDNCPKDNWVCTDDCPANYCFDDPLFYDKTAHTFRLSSVTIEYIDGKKKVLTGDELDVRVDYTDY